MKIKTGELAGKALDYAVAVAEGGKDIWYDTVATWWIKIHGEDRALSPGWGSMSFTPSTDWRQGGRIIDCEEIQWCKLDGQIEAWSGFDYLEWRASWDRSPFHPDGSGWGSGLTILISSMRCFVASKLGDEVEVPDQLGKT